MFKDRELFQKNPAVSVGLALALAGSALYMLETAEAAPEKREIAFIGDSNTRISEEAIRDRFEPEAAVTLDGQDGMRIDEMLDEIDDVVTNPAGAPDALVIYLGTNDVVQENPNWKEGFDYMVGAVSAVDCVQLVTVNTDTDAHFGDTNITASAINRAIDDAAEKHRNIHKVDWNVDWTKESVLQADSEHHYYTVNMEKDPNLPPAYFPDGVHHSPEGSQELARRISESIDKNCK